MNSHFDFLYNTSEHHYKAMRLIRKYYKPPQRIKGDWVLVADIPVTRYDDGSVADGKPVQIYESRLPATFYRLVADGHEVTTGSGDEVARVLCKLALNIANGMIGIRKSRSSK